MEIKKLLILSGIVIANSDVSAKIYNKNIPSFTLPFQKGTIELTIKQKDLVDSLYSAIVPGDGIRIEMIQPDELLFTEMERTKLAYSRSEAVIRYCYEKKFSREEFYAEIIPLTVPHTIQTDDLERASYRFYMRHPSKTSVIFTIDEKTATSQTTGVFDSNYQHDKQIFSYQPDENVQANLVSGTQITIPSGSLMFENGQEPKSEIIFEVAEYTEMDAIIMKAMTTTAGGRHLQTGGMWHISASSEGKPLIMKNGKHYSIEVAKGNDTKDMKVFTGKIVNGKLDWELQNDGSVTATTKSSANPINDVPDMQNPLPVNEINVDNNNLNNWNQKNLNVNKKAWARDEAYIDEATKTKIQTTEKAIYAMQLNDFGWINCDAFDETKGLTDVYIKGDIEKTTSVMLVYTKRKSVLPGYLCSDGKTVKFSNIAIDENPMLVVITKTDDPDVVLKHIGMINPSTQKSVTVKTTKAKLSSLQNDLKGKISDL